MKTKARSTQDPNGTALSDKLDTVIRLLEDLFILQALGMGVGRDHICSAIGVHTTRISNVNKGVKQALKNGKDEA